MGSSTSCKSTLGSSVIYNYILKWASLSLRRGESDKKDFLGGSLIDKEVIMKRSCDTLGTIGTLSSYISISSVNMIFCEHRFSVRSNFSVNIMQQYDINL